MFFQKKKNKKIGLVLGSGGARGFFHIGVINALRDLGIEINEIAGASMGAVIGLLYAANPDIDFEDVLDDFFDSNLFFILKKDYKKNVLNNIETFLKKYIKQKRIEELKIKFSFTATDLNKKTLVRFYKGKIFPNIISSVSFPGFIKPEKFEDKLLCDGGVICSVPLSNIKKCDNIIASDVSICLERGLSFKNIISSFDLLTNIPERYNFLRDVEIAKKEKKKIVSIEYDGSVHTFNFTKAAIKDIIKCGYLYTMQNKKQILRLIKK